MMVFVFFFVTSSELLKNQPAFVAYPSSEGVLGHLEWPMMCEGIVQHNFPSTEQKHQHGTNMS